MNSKRSNHWIPLLLRFYWYIMHYSALFVISAFCILLVVYVAENITIRTGSLSQIEHGDENKTVMITDWKGDPARLMKYKKYCIIAFYLESAMSKSLDHYDRITLVLHMTYDYFDEQIVEQVAGWDGPITLSVFLSLDYLSIQVEELKNKKKNLFNMNLLQLSRSKYILLSDYKFIFSYGFEGDMRKLADKYLMANPKAVLVCRIFEALGTISTVPRDKDNLRQCYNNQTAVEFHRQYAGKSHVIAGLQDWFAHNATDGQPSIDRPIPYKRYDWEPLFVSLTTIPFHDENFPYLIRDNTALRWEMCRMNYTFLVVNDHFTVHPGIKTHDDSLSLRLSLQQSVVKQFYAALAKFQKRMDQLYPETRSQCPKTRK